MLARGCGSSREPLTKTSISGIFESVESDCFFFEAELGPATATVPNIVRKRPKLVLLAAKRNENEVAATRAKKKRTNFRDCTLFLG
jgi:hypothetical protein